jgi:acetyl-CoA synthetase
VGRKVFGHPIHDNWWQTETGATMISNFAGMDVRPGSMGRPLPGVEVALVNFREDGTLEFGSEGQIAVRTGWPSMFSSK